MSSHDHGSQDEDDPVQRLLYDDDEYGRMVARCFTESASAPRRPPLADLVDYRLHLWAPPDARDYAQSGYPQYTTSSAGTRTSSIFADDGDDYDDDAYSKPADFMHLPPRLGRSQPGISSHRSSYTAEYRAPSSRSSDASSIASSVFTSASAATSSAMSFRPPRRPDITSFIQTPAASAVPDYVGMADAQPIVPAAARPLGCELYWLRDCSVTFALDQTNEWIDHHCRHLKDQYPARLVCWFCDHIPFISAGNSKNDRYGNFRDRMEHIRRHISDDDLTMNDMRPDFFMISYLGERGIIDPAISKHAFRYTEVPDALRLPGTSAAYAGAQPDIPQWRRPPGPGLAFDLDRERRHQRPRGGQRHRPDPVRRL